MNKREATRRLRDFVGEIVRPEFSTSTMLNVVTLELTRMVRAIDQAKEADDANAAKL